MCTNSILVLNLRSFFQNTRCIKSFFPYKDRFDRSQLSRLVYKANWWDCHRFYIGKTKRLLLQLKTERRSLYPPGRPKALAKSDNTSAIADHVKTTGHTTKWNHWYFGKGQNILPLQKSKLPYLYKYLSQLSMSTSEVRKSIYCCLIYVPDAPPPLYINRCFEFQRFFLKMPFVEQHTKVLNVHVQHAHHCCLFPIFDQTTMA